MRRPASAIVFVAVATLAACGGGSEAPKAAMVVKIAGEGQTGFPGDTLPDSVRIKVTDASGNPIPGINVTFAGTYLSVSPATAQSGSNGMVAARVILAALPDSTAKLVVHAGAASDSATTAIFSFFIKNPCKFPTALTIGTAANGALSSHDCGLGDGSFLDIYSFTTPANQRLSFGMTASFDTYLFLADTLFILGANDDIDQSTTNSRLDALLPPGSYQIWANSYDPAITGPYQVTSSVLATDMDNCGLTWTTDGVTTSQTLPTITCLTPDSVSRNADLMAIAVGPGSTVTATMTGASFAAKVSIFSGTSPLATATASGAGQPAAATYTVPLTQRGAVILLFASSTGTDAGANYTMSVTRAGPAGTPAPARLVPAGARRAIGLTRIR